MTLIVNISVTAIRLRVFMLLLQNSSRIRPRLFIGCCIRVYWSVKINVWYHYFKIDIKR